MTKSFVIAGTANGPQVVVDQAPERQYDELSLAADLQWRWDELLVQGELVMNEAAFTDEGRPTAESLQAPNSLTADYRRWGGYGLVGYRTPYLGAMPYTLFQYHNFADKNHIPAAMGVSLGVNVRPVPGVAIKGEYLVGVFDGLGSTGLGDTPFRTLQGQVAWAF